MPNRDTAIEIGMEQVRYMKQPGAHDFPFTTQVKMWCEAMDLDPLDWPEKYTPDEVTYWFARIWMERVATDE